MVQADLRRDPAGSWPTRRCAGLLDLARPVAAADGRGAALRPGRAGPAAASWPGTPPRSRPAAGSCVSHGTADDAPAVSQMAAHYQQTATPLRPRTRDELAEVLADVELVEPGIEFLPAWRPDHPDDVGSDVQWPGAYGAVGRLT